MRMEVLQEKAAQYGTPLYVFDTDILSEVVAEFETGLNGKAELCYAMKANPFLTDTMAKLVNRIEVCSMGEFKICRALGIPAEKVLISGVIKTKEDITEILDYYGGKCHYTVESPGQLAYFIDWCGKNKEELSLYLRLTSGNKFGMDEAAIKEIIAKRADYPLIHIKGIHYFSGTQKKLTKTAKELKNLDDFFETLSAEYQFKVEELEFGPGLFVNYFKGTEDTTQQDIAKIAALLSEMRFQGKVTLEMGRALCAVCGYYLTTVKDIKQNNGKNYCLVDGGIHQLNYDGQIRGMYQPYLHVLPERTSGEEKDWTVCGILCTVNDVLVQSVPLRELQLEDVLVFERTGAYSMTEGMALFLSHELPKVALYGETEGWKLLRDGISTYRFNYGTQ